MRGFKRVSPSEATVRSSTAKNQPARTRPPTTPRPPASTPPTPTNLKENANVNQTHPKENMNKSEERKSLYCHYFSNYGKCLFEERTGGTCKFQHKSAPMCKNGMSCQRSKCMYKHPNYEGRQTNQTFLEQSQFPQRNFCPPWQLQMMNPWLSQSQYPQNPWNMEMRR